MPPICATASKGGQFLTGADINTGYQPGPGRLLVRRPGPNRAARLSRCFGPFRLAGMAFRIHKGGGLWCTTASSPAGLRLVGTPAPVSEVLTEQPLRSARGTLTVDLRGPGATAEVGLSFADKPAWRVRVKAASVGRPIQISAFEGGHLVGALDIAGGHSGPVALGQRFEAAGI